MADKRQIEAYAELDELSLWVSALASDSESMDELRNLGRGFDRPAHPPEGRWHRR